MHGRWKENRFLKNNHQWTNHRTCWAAGQQHLDHWESSVLSSVHGTDIRCFRHLFSLNKWQYRDEYIKCCYRGTAVKKLQKKLRLKNCKKVAWMVFKPGIASYNSGHVHHWTTARAGNCHWPRLLNRNRKWLAVCMYRRSLYTRPAMCIDTSAQKTPDMVTEKCRLDVRKCSFSNRVFLSALWNALVPALQLSQMICAMDGWKCYM